MRFPFVFIAFDAWGKIPSGLMQGNIFWIGSVYECRHDRHSWNETLIEQPFQTRTCIIDNEIQSIDNIRPIYGLCVPMSCQANDIANLIHQGMPRTIEHESTYTRNSC
jgi:hypothetical protein